MSICNAADSIIAFFTTHAGLFYHEPDDHVVSFFLRGHFESRIPDPDSREFLLSCSTADLLRIVLNGEVPSLGGSTCPAHLQEFIQTAFRLRSQSSPVQDFEELVPVDPLRDAKLTEALRTGLKAKKKHEVDRLAGVIASMCSEHGIADIVNIGCGKNYLSQGLLLVVSHPFPVLSFRYGLNIVGVDHNRRLVDASVVQVRSVEARTGSKASFSAVQSHLSSDMSVDEFVALVEPEFVRIGAREVVQDDDDEPKRSGVLLLGLHTCGRLGITMLDLYLQLRSLRRVGGAVALASVPCCYHKLRDSTHDFPLSAYVRERWGECKGLSSAGYNLAAQSVEMWRKANVDEATGEFHCQGALFHCRRHSFRCVLEVLLRGWFEKSLLEPFVIGRIAKVFWTSFGTYCVAAVDKLRRKFPSMVYSDELRAKLRNRKRFVVELDAVYESYRPDEHGVIPSVRAFWILRAMLSPLLEELIVLDRCLYLEENGATAEPVKVFDDSVSPRNRLIRSI